MDIEKLIERLKYYGTTYAIGDNLGKEIDGSDELMLNAVTALSTLQAENEKLRAELEQVKQERDEAVKAIERVRSCKDCGYYTGEWTPPCKECQDSEEHHPYFKWRGQKED